MKNTFIFSITLFQSNSKANRDSVLNEMVGQSLKHKCDVYCDFYPNDNEDNEDKLIVRYSKIKEAIEFEH
tara:strand:- start:2 stop:211 length:210 start_codon:yes stop_codon:yes gene_type:complete